MIRTFQEAVKFLERYIPPADKKHPGVLGLERMRELTGRLGNPQLKYRTIHVGGTSGKGSTATMIASILGTKYKTGLYTSPHLVRINERFTVIEPLNSVQREISDGVFTRLINKIKPHVEAMGETDLGSPSYFEIVSALAFLHFYKEKAEAAVIEVGLGGLYDASNVVQPEIAVITNVGLDHTEILGETLEEIAADKAGIIKKGMKVISGTDISSVKAIFKNKSDQNNVPLFLAGLNFRTDIKRVSISGSRFDFHNFQYYRNLHLGMLGRHQVANAALAVKACEEFGGIGVKEIKSGLKTVKFAGRLEIIRKKPLIVLDGAHNPDKIKALVDAVREIWPGKKATTVLAIKKDKNAAGMIRLLSLITEKFILTNYRVIMDQGEISSYDPAELARFMQKHVSFEVNHNAFSALESAHKSAGNSDLILVTGSLYLVGIIRKKFIS